MRRREFIPLLGGAAAAWPFAVRAQQPARLLRRIGIFMPYAEGDVEYAARVRALREELARLGWTEGANVQFDERWTTDDMDRVRANAASLLASNPDVVVAVGSRVVSTLMQLTRSVPIVLPGAVDPVGTGWVESLARPGGNVTGFTALELPMFGKILEILKQIAPATTRVGLIYNPDNPTSVVFRRTIATFADRLAVEAVDLPIHKLADIERAVASLADQPNASVYFLPDVTVNALRTEVVTLVEPRRLPAMYSEPMFVKSGGLAFYGADRIHLYRRAAGYVDRILRGEKPAELPFQQPTKYQLMINLNAARTLGLTVPPTLLVAADEVIE
jgi:putative tryptophan/tyrosine transport system substrate-binding protein